MRTVKASEVVKGMRVRFEASNGDATITTEGVVTKATGTYIAALFFGDYGINLNPDHPVTVLAEPEPEWVEGAWYRFTAGGDRQYLGRIENGGMVEPDGTDYGSEYITVLGRVLIVDWPGDKWAADLDACNTGDGRRLSQYGFRDGHDAILKAVADAIRTQGGVR